VANGDSLVNDHKSNEGLHPSIPQEEGTCDTREACPLIEYSGLFFKAENNYPFVTMGGESLISVTGKKGEMQSLRYPERRS